MIYKDKLIYGYNEISPLKEYEDTLIYEVKTDDGTTYLDLVHLDYLFEYEFLRDTLNLSFNDFTNKLHNGEVISVNTMLLGNVLFSVRSEYLNKNKQPANTCTHSAKYISQNFSGGVRYWVCPTCKSDLGDA